MEGKSMSQPEQDKNRKQKKVQGLYRRIKQQNRENKNDNKIGAVIVSICVFIMILLLVMDSLFDAGFRFAQFWGK